MASQAKKPVPEEGSILEEEEQHEVPKTGSIYNWMKTAYGEGGSMQGDRPDQDMIKLAAEDLARQQSRTALAEAPPEVLEAYLSSSRPDIFPRDELELTEYIPDIVKDQPEAQIVQKISGMQGFLPYLPGSNLPFAWFHEHQGKTENPLNYILPHAVVRKAEETQSKTTPDVRAKRALIAHYASPDYFGFPIAMGPNEIAGPAAMQSSATRSDKFDPIKEAASDVSNVAATGVDFIGGWTVGHALAPFVAPILTGFMIRSGLDSKVDALRRALDGKPTASGLTSSSFYTPLSRDDSSGTPVREDTDTTPSPTISPFPELPPIIPTVDLTYITELLHSLINRPAIEFPKVAVIHGGGGAAFSGPVRRKKKKKKGKKSNLLTSQSRKERKATSEPGAPTQDVSGRRKSA
jgi:hypothetical protein